LAKGNSRVKNASRVFSLFVAVMLCGSLPGQRTIIPVPQDALTSVDQVNYISETSDGYVSFSGNLGITFFDGGLGRELSSDKGASFKQPPQSPCYEDDGGTLWFTTYNALYKYVRSSGEVRKIQFVRDEKIISEAYRAFDLNVINRTLMLRAGDEIWSFDIDEETYVAVAGPVNSVSLAINPAGNLIAGATWFSDSVEIFRLAPSGNYAFREVFAGNGNALKVIFATSDSIAYLGTTNGLAELHIGSTRTECRLVERTEMIEALSLTHDRSGIWFAVRGQGIRHYATQSEEVTHRFSEADGLSGKTATALLHSKTGALWIAYTNGAIDYMIPSKSSFKTLFKTHDNRISDIVETNEGEVIIGLNSGETLSLPPQENAQFKVLDHRGKFQSKLFTEGDRVFQLDFRQLHVRAHGEWRTLARPESMLDDFFPGGGAPPLALNLSGVEEFTIFKDTLLVRPAVGFPVVDNLDFVKILPFPDTSFLLSYQTKELWHCIVANGRYKVIGKYPLEGPVLSAVKTPNESIYVGTPTGLFLLSDGRFVPCLPSSPLTGRGISVNSLTYDEDGNLWCGTPRGLICYRPEMQRYNYFDKIDGLISNHFLNVRALLPVPGEIWMATDSGLVSFEPKELLNLAQIATPYVAGIWVNDLRLDNQRVLQEVAPISEPFIRNSLSFKLASVAPTRSDFSAIEYQLKDYDLNAISVSPNTTIRYPNLPPGNYTLQLTAINRNGLPSGKKRLAITINPPFTQTLLFYLLCTCVLALIAIGLYILGLRRERLKQERLQEQQARLAAERDRIAGEVHDDLGGQISSILYLSEEMLMTGSTPEYEYELSRINELSRSSLQNVRDIIFALDNRKASLSALGEQLRGAGETFFGDRKIGFRSSEEYHQPDFVLTSRQKRNLMLIVKEAWHNIAKNAKASVVTLDIQERDQQLIISVTDNGVGFTTSKSESSMGGYGLDNMKNKAIAIGGQLIIESTPSKGTSLQVTWSLPLRVGCSV
jgi:signal transduction histidine kinase/ligand-binding sensor domain-containing protein